MKTKIWHYIVAFIVLTVCIYITIDSLVTDSNIPVSVSFLFSIGIMNLVLGYLSPEFQKRDERMRLIREKGMFYSYFAIITYFLAFIILLGFGIINISAFTVIALLLSLVIFTVFISMFIFSFVY